MRISEPFIRTNPLDKAVKTSMHISKIYKERMDHKRMPAFAAIFTITILPMGQSWSICQALTKELLKIYSSADTDRRRTTGFQPPA